MKITTIYQPRRWLERITGAFDLLAGIPLVIDTEFAMTHLEVDGDKVTFHIPAAVTIRASTAREDDDGRG